MEAFLKKFINILRFGLFKYVRTTLAERRLKFPHYLAVAAIAKDEGPYFREWIEYHRLIGVDKFYIYDNESTDNTREILQPYIDSGLVEYIYFPGKCMQNPMFADVVARHKNDTRWLTHIDLDEFIVPINTDTVPDFLNKMPRNVKELIITWAMYGSDGHMTKPAGLVVENYMHRGRVPYGCKAIVNPRFVQKMTQPHVINVAGDMVDENMHRYGHVDHAHNPPPYNKIRINHYHCKSWQEYEKRRTRGDAAFGDIKIDHEKMFKQNDKNEVFDDTIKKYIPRLKKAMKV